MVIQHYNTTWLGFFSETVISEYNGVHTIALPRGGKFAKNSASPKENILKLANKIDIKIMNWLSDNRLLECESGSEFKSLFTSILILTYSMAILFFLSLLTSFGIIVFSIWLDYYLWKISAKQIVFYKTKLVHTKSSLGLPPHIGKNEYT